MLTELVKVVVGIVIGTLLVMVLLGVFGGLGSIVEQVHGDLAWVLEEVAGG